MTQDTDRPVPDGTHLPHAFTGPAPRALGVSVWTQGPDGGYALDVDDPAHPPTGDFRGNVYDSGHDPRLLQGQGRPPRPIGGLTWEELQERLQGLGLTRPGELEAALRAEHGRAPSRMDRWRPWRS